MRGTPLLSLSLFVIVSACRPPPPAPDCTLSSPGSLHPHHTSCALFYLCEKHDVIHLLSCPSGYHFQAEGMDTCVSASAPCDLCLTSDDLIQHLEFYAEGNLEMLDTREIVECSPTPTCGLTENGYKKPYPSDCTKYIFCEFGMGTVTSCPAGEEFSPSASKCMSRDLANCPKCPYEVTTTTPAEEPNICPETPDCGPLDIGHQKPYPPNCNLFLYCDQDRVPILSGCMEGLHFSPTLKECMAPEEANCPDCVPREPEVTTTEMSTTPACPPIPTCNLFENGYKKPYPSDCTYYIYCDTGIGEKRKCPLSLPHFSPTETKCMTIDEAMCTACIESLP